jgi:3-deoxy-manno-octulosonate cytidylyltransferase (CMP-KDO synthetase)
MKKLAVIPARYAATRFPAKLMQPLGNKTVIRTTYDNTVATGLFDEVLVATDSRIIFEEIAAQGGLVVMSKKEHESGSDRIAEAIHDRDVDIVVNVQGDEPFINRQTIADLLAVFNDDAVQVASLMHLINDPDMIKNPNVVKVATDIQGNALFFSRSPIPYHRNMETHCPYYRHIGVYAYRKEVLLSFVKWPMGRLENIEKLEQLRYLENGIQIRMVATPFEAVGIDTPEDLLKAREFLQTNP